MVRAKCPYCMSLTEQFVNKVDYPEGTKIKDMTPDKILSYRCRCLNCQRWHVVKDRSEILSISKELSAFRSSVSRRETVHEEKSQQPRREAWARTRGGKWHKKRLFSREEKIAIVLVSLALIFFGFGLSKYGPQRQVTESSGSCPLGGTYFGHISTVLCGQQYDICVSFNGNCGDDYHPPRVKRNLPVYGIESILLILVGIAGMLIGACLPRHIRTPRELTRSMS